MELRNFARYDVLEKIYGQYESYDVMKYRKKDFDRFWEQVQGISGLRTLPYPEVQCVYTYNRDYDLVEAISGFGKTEVEFEKISKEDFRRMWKKPIFGRISLSEKNIKEVIRVHAKKELATELILRYEIHWWQ